jgi:hypothetical protein
MGTIGRIGRDRARRQPPKGMPARACRSWHTIVAIVVAMAAASPGAQAPARPPAVFRSGTELVTVNVVVRDRSGAVVRGLSQDDFVVTEDDKAQTITSFDFEELDRLDGAPATRPRRR